MIFRKNKVDISHDTLKLRIEIVECLLKHRFTWDEIFKGTGFSEAWYMYTKKEVEEKEKRRKLGSRA